MGLNWPSLMHARRQGCCHGTATVAVAVRGPVAVDWFKLTVGRRVLYPPPSPPRHHHRNIQKNQMLNERVLLSRFSFPLSNPPSPLFFPNLFLRLIRWWEMRWRCCLPAHTSPTPTVHTETTTKPFKFLSSPKYFASCFFSSIIFYSRGGLFLLLFLLSYRLSQTVSWVNFHVWKSMAVVNWISIGDWNGINNQPTNFQFSFCRDDEWVRSGRTFVEEEEEFNLSTVVSAFDSFIIRRQFEKRRRRKGKYGE